jgi:hypothetical protein
MRNEDPGEKQQKALPVCVYCKLHWVASFPNSSSSDLDIAVADLLTLAFFFSMRSCEYADIEGERRTKSFAFVTSGSLTRAIMTFLMIYQTYIQQLRFPSRSSTKRKK